MINKIKSLRNRIQKSKDGSALASNFGYLMLLQIASYIFPFITIPYLARVIGVEGFGKIAFAAAVVMWFQTIADWGFNYTATRDVARNRDNPEKVSEIFSNVLWARIVLMLLSFALLMIAIATIPYFKDNQAVLLLTFLLVPGHILLPEWFFQAMERMKFITIFSLVSKAIFTVLIFIFIKEKSDFILQPIFVSLSYIICGIFSMYMISVRWKVKILAPRWGEIYKTIKGSKDVFINNIMPNLYNNFSLILLGFFGGSVANGLLDAGSKFVSIVVQLMGVMSRVFFPFLSRRLDKHNLYMSINLSIAIFSCLALFFTAPLIVRFFYTPEFEQAILILRIMSLSIVFLALNNIYGVNYMIVKGYEKQLRNITFICSIMGFLISFPLVYFYSYIGAAITITFTRCILGIAVSYKARKLIFENCNFGIVK